MKPIFKLLIALAAAALITYLIVRAMRNKKAGVVTSLAPIISSTAATTVVPSKPMIAVPRAGTAPPTVTIGPGGLTGYSSDEDDFGSPMA